MTKTLHAHDPATQPRPNRVCLQLDDGSTLSLQHESGQHDQHDQHGRHGRQNQQDPPGRAELPSAARLERALAAAAFTLRTGGEGSTAPLRLGMICGDPAMQTLVNVLKRVAPTDTSILVTGENGTGKELVARALHAESDRAAGPFIAVNCSALNDHLLESELFGHRRGSFTGAVQDRMGMFEAADGGTLFLDEIGDMSPALQAKLLRVLQEGQVVPVGDTATRTVDVRIVAATHRSLTARIREGLFREDLFYRLNVVSLELPALRMRGDLDLLAGHFLTQLSRKHGGSKSLSAAARACLHAHAWPGNIRELSNELERAWVLSGDAEELQPEHLRSRLSTTANPDHPAATDGAGCDLQSALVKVERGLIAEALKQCEGNRTHTARSLGISRRNLLRKIAQLGLS